MGCKCKDKKPAAPTQPATTTVKTNNVDENTLVGKITNRLRQITN